MTKLQKRIKQNIANEIKHDKKIELAMALRKDLTNDALINYAKEQQRMLVNESKMKRSTKIYEFRLQAALWALKIL